MLTDPMVLRARVLLAWVAVICAIAFSFPAAAQSVSQPGRGSPLRAELLDAARSTFEAETNGPVEFVVRRLNVSGD